jgi:hypothetical protein
LRDSAIRRIPLLPDLLLPTGLHGESGLEIAVCTAPCLMNAHVIIYSSEIRILIKGRKRTGLAGLFCAI